MCSSTSPPWSGPVCPASPKARTSRSTWWSTAARKQPRTSSSPRNFAEFANGAASIGAALFSCALTNALRHHLDVPIQELVAIGFARLERMLEAEIGRDQLVIALHSFGVERAERDIDRSLVAHQLFHAAPLVALLGQIEAA